MEFKIEKKHILIAGIILAVIIISVVIGVFLYQTSSSYKIKTTLKQEISYLMQGISDLNKATYKYLSVNLDKNKKSTSSKNIVSSETDFSFDLDITKNLDKTKNKKIFTIENALNNSEITLTTTQDSSNRYTENNIKYKNDEEKLDANIYFQDNNIYLYAKNFLDKDIALLNDSSSENYKFITKILNSGISFSEINSLLSIVKLTIDDVNLKENIVSTKEVLEIDGINQKVNKDKLVINNKLATTFTMKLIENIIKNPTALEIIKKVNGNENVSETKTILVNCYNNLKAGKIKLLKENRTINTNIYMKGLFPKFLKQEFEYNVDGYVNSKLTYSQINLNGYSNRFVLEKGKYTLNLVNLKGNLSNQDFKLVIQKNNQDKYLAEVSGVVSPKKIDLAYSLKSLQTTMLSGKMEYSQSYESKTKRAKFRLEFDAENMDYGKGRMEVTSTIKGLNSVKKHQLKNQINYKDLTEADRMQIRVTTLKKLPHIYTLINW